MKHLIPSDQYCPHCLPAKRRHHIRPYIEHYLKGVSNLAEKYMRPILPTFLTPDVAWRYILQSYCYLGVAEFTDTPERSQLYNRSNIFLEAAEKRDIQIETFSFNGSAKHEFRFRHQGHWYYFDHIPLAYRKTDHDVDDKEYARNHLNGIENIPIPDGGTFYTKKTGMEFGEYIGFPVVVKPRDGSLSCHATYPVTNKEELSDAIDIAKQYQPAYIIEEFIEGDIYRASVLGQDKVFICKKEKPHVIGDGSSTIKELIGEKNSDPKRGPTDANNSTLHKITINDELEQLLSEQDLTIDSVPDENERVILHSKYTLAAGCEIIEWTEDTHPENIALFKRVAKSLDANIIGIDFICQDITRPHTDQKCGIIETNSRPYVDMHQYPSSGTGKDVANAGWNIVLSQLDGTHNAE